MSQELITAIKKAAGTYRNDIVNYYIGVIVAQEDGSAYDEDDLTVIVQVISSKSVTNMPADNTYSGNLSVNTTQTQLNAAVDQLLPGVQLSNVHLLCGVDDGPLLVPTIGSQVVVMTSTYQNPFIVQFSSVDIVSNFFNTSYQVNVGVGGGNNFTDYNQNDNQIQLKANNADSSSLATATITQTSIDLNITSGATLAMDTKFDVRANNGAELKGDTKLTIKNSSTNLNNILNDIKTALNDINSVIIPSGGGAIATLAPDLSIRIGNISAGITSLLE